MLTEAEKYYEAEHGVRFPLFLTQQEYERLPHDDQVIDELIEGELIVSPGAISDHRRLARRIERALQPLEQHGFEVMAEATVQLPGRLTESAQPSTMQPDIALFDVTRMNQETRIGPNKTKWPTHILLAMEIVSPGNTKRELDRKIQNYLLIGAYEVWIIEQSLGVRIVRRNGISEYVERGIVSTPHPLPQIDLDFNQLFAD